MHRCEEMVVFVLTVTTSDYDLYDEKTLGFRQVKSNKYENELLRKTKYFMRHRYMERWFTEGQGIDGKTQRK